MRGAGSFVSSPEETVPIYSASLSSTAMISGLAAAVVSMMRSKALETAPSLPARSTALAVKLWLPSGSAVAIWKIQLPPASATVSPSKVVPS
ncbi:hypothetical protein BTE77_35670 [Ensifer adhaerens]|nr:hypothetical protein BTE77_35670 [Ensifer adhaerens]